MIPVKTNPENPCFYSDTDLVFTQYPLPSNLVRTKLGQFKDELKGDYITKVIFLKNKFYV